MTPLKRGKKTVLLIDDVYEMREMLESMINGFERYQVSASCANCAEARLELLRRKPSLVLLDEVLPGESSLDLLAEMTGEGIPVVLMTGMENPNHELPRGARIRISKPDWKSLDQDSPRIESVFDQILAQPL